MKRTAVTLIVLLLNVIISLLLWMLLTTLLASHPQFNLWAARGVFAVLTVVFFAGSIKTIPADPPHKAILVFLGKRQDVVLNEGWNFVPLYPTIFSYILIKVEKVNFDLENQEVRTPDKALIIVKASMTFIPGIKASPESLITYLNSGGEAGVKRILHDVIEDRVKTWAGSNKEGPSTWMEAQTLKDDIHEVLVKTILSTKLDKIDSDVPTNTWMRFFDSPQTEPTDYDALPRNGWASKPRDAEGAVTSWNWNGLQGMFNALSPAKQKKLKKQIDERREAVKCLRDGKGDGYGDESLGITIVRFTINEVKVGGEVAKVADQMEKERRQREADKMEIDNVADRIRTLRATGLSPEESAKVVQVERDKATRMIVDITGNQTALGADLIGAAVVNRSGVGAQPPKRDKAKDEDEPKSGGKKKVADMTEEEKQRAYENMRKGKGFTL